MTGRYVLGFGFALDKSLEGQELNIEFWHGFVQLHCEITGLPPLAGADADERLSPRTVTAEDRGLAVDRDDCLLAQVQVSHQPRNTRDDLLIEFGILEAEQLEVGHGVS